MHKKNPNQLQTANSLFGDPNLPIQQIQLKPPRRAINLTPTVSPDRSWNISHLKYKSGLTMEFRERMLCQVYNLCLHNVWSLHPSYVQRLTHSFNQALNLHTHSRACVHKHTPSPYVLTYNHQSNDYIYSFLLIWRLVALIYLEVCVLLLPVKRLGSEESGFKREAKQHEKNTRKKTNTFHHCDSFFCLFRWLYIYLSKKGLDPRRCGMINQSCRVFFFILSHPRSDKALREPGGELFGKCQPLILTWNMVSLGQERCPDKGGLLTPTN